MPANETHWWRPVENSQTVICDLCPRECRIAEGHRGFCFVRANEGGKLVLTTYGKSSGFCIDPIEKKPLFHFLPGTPILSLGTAGCNLGCKFCQNWDISKSREMDTLGAAATPEAIVAAAQKTGCRSIAFTYNDPVTWAEYAMDTAKLARQAGIKTVAVTAGYINPAPRRAFYEWMDAANVDLKGFTDAFYRKLCAAHLQPVLDTLEYLVKETPVWTEITTLVIPGENDSLEDNKRMCGWILEKLGDSVPLHFTAFHPDHKMRDTPPTPPATLRTLRDMARQSGLKHVYVGNVHDDAGQSTCCPGCGATVIGRDWHTVRSYAMAGNRCANCQTVIPGVFDAGATRPGAWGGRRLPVRIADFVPITIQAPATRSLPPAMPTPSAAPAPVVAFDGQAQTQLFAHVRAVVRAAVLGEPAPRTLPAALAAAPTYGVFVTLRRGHGLRACLGRWGLPLSPLETLLTEMAASTARGDSRFPPIAAAELDLLSVDISLMHSPRDIPADPAAIQIGRDGLVLQHPQSRGLLLPHVATEQGWDAPTFLTQLGHKAGLGGDAWRNPATRLMAFETRLYTQEAPAPELDAAALTPAFLEQLTGLANGLPADADPLVDRVFTHELALILAAPDGRQTVAFGANRSLRGLVESGLASLAQSGAPQVAQLAVLHTPLPVLAADYPQRCGHLANHAVLGFGEGERVAFQLSLDPVGDVLRALGGRAERITVFAASHGPASPTRPPARAGQFYPADPVNMTAEVKAHLDAGVAGAEEKAVRAVMLPHAGWVYCGATIGKTLSGVRVPDRVILLGPKHTPLGPDLSAASHAFWQIPGGAVTIATELAQRLARAVPGLACEGEAHRLEHACEVLLPFLQHKNPAVRILPLAMGGAAGTRHALARALADVLAEDPAILLVISSDMNHYAPEAETLRRDRLALEQLLAGDADGLLQTCAKHDISMCGVLPAAVAIEALRFSGAPWQAQLRDHRTSGVVSGDRASVVGYAGVVVG